jgi:hypothetical protein
MREEICTSQDLDTRETQRLSSARLQQLPLGSVGADLFELDKDGCIKSWIRELLARLVQFEYPD